MLTPASQPRFKSVPLFEVEEAGELMCYSASRTPGQGHSPFFPRSTLP